MKKDRYVRGRRRRGGRRRRTGGRIGRRNTSRDSLVGFDDRTILYVRRNLIRTRYKLDQYLKGFKRFSVMIRFLINIKNIQNSLVYYQCLLS